MRVQDKTTGIVHRDYSRGGDNRGVTNRGVTVCGQRWTAKGSGSELYPRMFIVYIDDDPEEKIVVSCLICIARGG